MEQLTHTKSRFRGVGNIIRFNWHFYAGAGILLGDALLLSFLFTGTAREYIQWFVLVAAIPICLSLAASWYVYDLSGLYTLPWLRDWQGKDSPTLVNLHAGFDESSFLLRQRFPNADLMVLDFYDPARHTEVSIRRARKALPAFPGTIPTSTRQLPLADNSVDLAFLFLAAHEIRNHDERAAFFREIARSLHPDGRAFVIEHLRDGLNFFAYNIGFLHFHSRKVWLKTFAAGGLTLASETKHTPFLSIFELRSQ